MQQRREQRERRISEGWERARQAADKRRAERAQHVGLMVEQMMRETAPDRINAILEEVYAAGEKLRHGEYIEGNARQGIPRRK